MMHKKFSRIHHFIQTNLELLLFLLTMVISDGAIIYFILHGNQNLGDYDAVARLNIARKITDSLTPGLGQLGGVWLPFPQILYVPLVRIDFLWHTGLAGSIISGISFIVGAIYLQKTVLLITKSIRASLLVWFMYVANINILFLQTMALSEMFFLTCIIMVLYFLTRWIQGHDLQIFLIAGLFLILITLTRYEGYFIFIGSVIVVLIECIRMYRRESWQKVEGMVLLFLTVAGFGIVMWCLYCFLFYGDFLYWLHLYSQGTLQVSTATHSVKETHASVFKIKQNSLATSFTIYSEIIMWMNGKITTFLGIFGFITLISLISKRYRQKKPMSTYLPIYLPLLIISVVLFGFLVYGYQKGFIPEVVLPPKLIPLIARKSFTIYSDSNMRYGIILAPCLLLFAGIAAAKNKFFYFVVIVLFGLQLFVNMLKPQYLQYALPHFWPYSTLTQVSPFLSLYDHGVILVSSNAHEDFMFQTKLPYDRFIYEGSRDLWTESLDNPAEYADWVIYDNAIQGDSVSYFMTDNARRTLQKKFTLVYDIRGFKIWHKR
jgi:hypothetical protein